MFKGIKENEYVKKILEFWNIPRYRSLIKLGIYIIFFTLVIVSIKNQDDIIVNSNDTNKGGIMETYKKMDNYQYRATIQSDVSRTLVGRVYENRQLIIFNDNNYYYNNVNLYKREEGTHDVYLETQEKLLEFEVWRFNPIFINALIERGQFESKTEYADGIIASTYLVDLADFVELYFGDKDDFEEDIIITMYQDNEMVTKVELDLTPIYQQGQFVNSSYYKVTIEYEQINQIIPITVNIESSD